MEEFDPTVPGPLRWVARVEVLPKSIMFVAAVTSSLGRWVGGEGGGLSSNGEGLLVEPKLDLEDVLR